MESWEGKICIHCKGDMVDKNIDLLKRYLERRILVERVPAGVCKDCGARFYPENLIKAIDNMGEKKGVIEKKDLWFRVLYS